MLTGWHTPGAHFQSEAPRDRSDKIQDTSLYSRGNKTRACATEAPGHAEEDAKERQEAHPQLLRYSLPPAPLNFFTAGAEPLGQAHEPFPTTGTEGRRVHVIFDLRHALFEMIGGRFILLMGWARELADARSSHV